MKKLFVAWLVVLLPLSMLGQEDSAKPQPAVRPAQAAYKIDFKVSELQGGKPAGSHTYSLLQANDAEWARLRMGSRVPVQVNPNAGFNYMDVGANIDSKAKETPSGIFLQVTVEMTSIVTQQRSGADNLPPVTRNYKFSTETIVSPDRPAVLNASDDPASDRRVQLEVTVTKLK